MLAHLSPPHLAGTEPRHNGVAQVGQVLALAVLEVVWEAELAELAEWVQVAEQELQTLLDMMAVNECHTRCQMC